MSAQRIPAGEELIERLATAPDPGLRQLVVELGYEEGARMYLERLRWPGGTRCPRCDATSVLRLQARRKYHCATCKYQFRVTAGTRLHDSHVPGWKWLVAVDLMKPAKLAMPDGMVNIQRWHAQVSQRPSTTA